MHRKDIHRIALVWGAAFAGVAIAVNAQNLIPTHHIDVSIQFR